MTHTPQGHYTRNGFFFPVLFFGWNKNANHTTTDMQLKKPKRVKNGYPVCDSE